MWRKSSSQLANPAESIIETAAFSQTLQRENRPRFLRRRLRNRISPKTPATGGAGILKPLTELACRPSSHRTAGRHTDEAGSILGDAFPAANHPAESQPGRGGGAAGNDGARCLSASCRGYPVARLSLGLAMRSAPSAPASRFCMADATALANQRAAEASNASDSEMLCSPQICPQTPRRRRGHVSHARCPAARPRPVSAAAKGLPAAL